MPTENEANAVVEKTRELCQAILNQPHLASAREHIAALMGNDQARGDYDALMSVGQTLQDKQERSIPLSDGEVAHFEAQRDKVLNNPVSRAFLEAQQAMQEVRHSVNKYVSMALETGRVPTEEDFQAATCGHGCNCH